MDPGPNFLFSNMMMSNSFIHNNKISAASLTTLMGSTYSGMPGPGCPIRQSVFGPPGPNKGDPMIIPYWPAVKWAVQMQLAKMSQAKALGKVHRSPA